MTEQVLSQAHTRYQSDLIVDLMPHYEFAYVSINPDASFRGLPDTLTNYSNDNPKLPVSNH